MVVSIYYSTAVGKERGKSPESVGPPSPGEMMSSRFIGGSFFKKYEVNNDADNAVSLFGLHRLEYYYRWEHRHIHIHHTHIQTILSPGELCQAHEEYFG